MRVKLYIVTYKNAKHLHENLESLFAAGDDGRLEVTVINNHSGFHLDPVMRPKVRVLHNSTRPDFSTGHLSRNWNQALIHGFRSLSEPDADIVITAQDDTLWQEGFLDALIGYHGGNVFLSFGHGDNVCSYTVDAVRHIGLWDERYCNIGYQELDYYLRAIKFAGWNVSINDSGHTGRTFRPLENTVMVRPDRNDDKLSDHSSSTRFHDVSRKVFRHKWGFDPDEEKPFEAFLSGIPHDSRAWMMYPYFEKDVVDLPSKYYCYPEAA